MHSTPERIAAVKKTHESSWLAVDGVVAVGIGRISGNRIGIVISVKKDCASIRARIPPSVEGVAVELRETGEIHPL